MHKFCFIVPTCVREDKHLNTLKECLSSIRKHHEDLIVIIVDFTTTLTMPSEFNNILFEYPDDKIPADMLTYDFLIKNKYAEKSLVIQDSMSLQSKVDYENIQFAYLWYFKNHIKEWSIIKEPQTEYNSKNHIYVHDDLVIDCIKNYTSGSFKNFALEFYHEKEKWNGCFGCLTLINISLLEKLNQETNIIQTMKCMTNNRMRRAIESIFSIACQYTFEDVPSSLDGLYYDGVYHNNFKTTLIRKICHDRQ